ncbi:Hydroxyproline-rich glyco family [Olea europaea subsp. europaea]|uniref:Hydroxyproline-rich glyco family n=2 Tax=Olea europaea subsp. europaea TaxID=158383 RepID=A0A8S0S6Q2_OLEEU|nr:Hydroxyproline-rich glyco family [Olea europaea subsp. europaea]
MLALVMENPYHAPTAHGDDGSRLSLGFPLGTALLLLLIFILSGIFSCLCHWEKICSLRPAAAAAGMDLDGGNTLAPSTSKPTNMDQSLPVLMPGDHVPKFIALPCSCQPPPPGRIFVEVQKPPPSLGVAVS